MGLIGAVVREALICTGIFVVSRHVAASLRAQNPQPPQPWAPLPQTRMMPAPPPGPPLAAPRPHPAAPPPPWPIAPPPWPPAPRTRTIPPPRPTAPPPPPTG